MMDENIERVIQNIIHIDRSAAELRKKVEDDLIRKRLELDDKVELLKYEILQKKEEELNILKEQEIKNIQKEEQRIIEGYTEKSKELEDKYNKIKEIFLKDIYQNILFLEDR
ncbi:hypothetical protein TCEL_00630 [Thermobrachium celere DSM 8682]|uniref:Uncharacterized protein n=2 Tax=Thermobrachium TaxID=150333 RepID=R7RRC4_9CLOT|nr:hypothetical protein TCEL_00630 [Thermobrachium celere DSM 8682]